MEIRVLNAGDWIGLYVDGNLVLENHELGIRDVVNAIAPDANFAEVEVDELPQGVCPPKWNKRYDKK